MKAIIERNLNRRSRSPITDPPERPQYRIVENGKATGFNMRGSIFLARLAFENFKGPYFVLALSAKDASFNSSFAKYDC
jgi:hypothetical protein